MDLPEAWTEPSGHLLHESWTLPWIRDGLAALIADLEATAPPGLDGTRTAFRRQGQTAKINSLSPTLRRDIAIGELLDLRVELLAGVKLIRAGVLTKVSKQTPDFECNWQGKSSGSR